MTIPDPARRVERILVDGSLVIKPLTSESSLLSLIWHENCGMRIPVFMLDFATKQALEHNYASPPFEQYRAMFFRRTTRVTTQLWLVIRS